MSNDQRMTNLQWPMAGVLRSVGVIRVWSLLILWSLDIGHWSFSLSLIFPFIEPLEHGEAGLFGVADGERLELDGRTEGGDDFAHRFLARRALSQLRRAERPAQSELAAASR